MQALALWQFQYKIVWQIQFTIPVKKLQEKSRKKMPQVCSAVFLGDASVWEMVVRLREIWYTVSRRR